MQVQTGAKQFLGLGHGGTVCTPRGPAALRLEHHHPAGPLPSPFPVAATGNLHNAVKRAKGTHYKREIDIHARLDDLRRYKSTRLTMFKQVSHAI
jgi:hypothetical protein